MVKWTGDRAAFFEGNRRIVEPLVKAQAVRWFGGQAGNHVGDLTSDVWWALLYTSFGHSWLAKTETEDQLCGLVVVVCRKKAYTLLKHRIAKKRDYRLELGQSHVAPDRPYESVVDPAPNPEERAIKNEELACLDEAIEVLPCRDREVIRLRLAGVTLREIAEIQSVTWQAIEQREFRARKRLRGLMEKRGHVSIL